MRPRTLLLLLAVVAALGAFIWFYERELPSSEERARLEKRVLPVEKDDVTALTLESELGTVRMEKVKLPAKTEEEEQDEDEIDTTPDTEWRILQPLKARADTFAVDGLLDALTTLEQTRVLDDVDPGQAGLDRPRRLLAVAAQRVAEVLPADQLADRLQLVAMQQVDRHQHVLDARERPADLDVALAEARECNAPNAQ